LKIYLLIARSILVFGLTANLALLPALAEEEEETTKTETAWGDDDTDLTDEFAFLEEDDVVESAARHRQEIGMSPSAITVITRADIEASGATCLADLLRLVPGMDVVISTPFFSSITSRLHWTYENNHYLVLVDGREANNELMGYPPFEILPFSLTDIERIEVIRGAGSSLYGANAIGGVINITTRAVPEKTSGAAHLITGNAGFVEVGARAATRFGDWGMSVSGGIETMGTFLDPTAKGRDVWKARAVIEYRLSDTKKFLLDAGFSEGSGIAPTKVGSINSTNAIRAVRLAYESEDLQGQLYWSQLDAGGTFSLPLEYQGIVLAEFKPVSALGNTLDGQVQYSIPRFWEPLLIIVGGGARLSHVASDNFLDADTFNDPNSSAYREPGVSKYEGRGGLFVHGELAPADWVTITGGLRFDYSNVTEEFWSPRLATVFKPADGQFIRLGVARAFRKPAFLESSAHVMVDFPEGSPITGPAQDTFLEFMTRVIGNSQLGNEELLSFEVGYLGQFFDGEFSLALDLYYNIYTNRSEVVTNIVQDGTTGLPDLYVSSLMFENTGHDIGILGWELSLKYNPTKNISLLASWSYKEVLSDEFPIANATTPKNLFTLGGRFISEIGALGSLYIFTRSKMIDDGIENPSGILEEALAIELDNFALILARFGWKFTLSNGVELETGLNLMLPIAPFSGSHFTYRERGGAIDADGRPFGGVELATFVTGYLQGSF
jgi:outer membrane receptor protein involved in Fe transport